MYGQTQYDTYTTDCTFDTFAASQMAAPYCVRKAGVKVAAWLDTDGAVNTSGGPSEWHGLKFDEAPHIPQTDTPLRAALPSSVTGLSPSSQCAHAGWRAPPDQTGRSDFLAVLDQMSARHRTVFAAGALQAAFAAANK